MDDTDLKQYIARFSKDVAQTVAFVKTLTPEQYSQLAGFCKDMAKPSDAPESPEHVQLMRELFPDS